MACPFHEQTRAAAQHALEPGEATTQPSAATVLASPPDSCDLKREAMLFLRQHAAEQVLADERSRLAAVQHEISETGTYHHTLDELTFGARVAWRNTTRCVGRLYWRSMEVRDLRHLTTAEAVFAALVEHLQLATNGGAIRSMISVFAAQEPGQDGIRIWNPQLIRYAGYRQPDGSVVGDPLHVELTAFARELGWQSPAASAFDLLPVIIQMPGERPQLFELPREAVLEVPLSHPTYPWFAELGLKWHALPVISNMRLEIGGVSYPAAPFNGWYMGTEIGARNFGDADRYNVLPAVAAQLGLNTRSERSLWKDRALVEVNIAVLHSFQQQGVKVLDHHTATRQFMLFEQQEHQARRPVYADWSWIVPPMAGSATPVFHRSYDNVTLTPNFFPLAAPWPAQAGSASVGMEV